MSIINLLPEDYIQRATNRRANMIFVCLFAVTLVTVVTAALVSERSSRRTRGVRDTVEESYDKAASQLRELQELEVRKQNMLGKAEAISALLERVPRSHLLGVIANCMPDNTSLTRVEMDTKRLVVAAPDPKTVSKFDASTGLAAPKPPTTLVTLEIVGLAGTDVEVARMIASLARNSLVSLVDLVYSQEKLIEKIPVREFQIHLELKPDADAATDMNEPLAAAEAAGGQEVKGVE